MSLKFTGEFCVMTMKNDTKFEEELTCQFKIDMRNLTNFDQSTRKSGEFCVIKKSSLFFNNFIKKETLVQVFSCEFCETSKNTFFFTEHLRWLLLVIQSRKHLQFSNYNRITDLSFFCHIYPRTNSTMIYFHESVLFVAFTVPFTTFFLRV